ncbi:hypothetical protein D5086_020376 [Populus alba]|uniref:Uncharacterized protein n=1 Tax=Populus alba TaxID=43335 RepID=A0ACC4BL90_POPAL
MGVLIMSSPCGIRHFELVFLHIAECIESPPPKTGLTALTIEIIHCKSEGHDFDMSPLFSYRKELNQVVMQQSPVAENRISHTLNGVYEHGGNGARAMLVDKDKKPQRFSK